MILNKESTAWGSFFYDQAKDAVRFTTRPQAGEFQEYLAYTFESPGPAGVTLTLHWEKVSGADSHRRRHAGRGLGQPAAATAQPARASSGRASRRRRRGAPGTTPTWTVRRRGPTAAIAMNRNYQTLRAKALVLERKGEAAAAAALREEAMKVATEADINAYGYELMGAGKVDEAIAIFRKNVADHPASWNTYDSLGEALALKGQTAEAVAQYTKALSDGRRRHQQEAHQRDPGKAGRQLEVTTPLRPAGTSATRDRLSVADPPTAARRNPARRRPGR